MTVLNFFDEMDINPITLQAEINTTEQVMFQICKAIGDPRTYGKSADEIDQEVREAEIKRVFHCN